MDAQRLGASPWRAHIRLDPADLLPLLEGRIDAALLAELVRAFSLVRFASGLRGSTRARCARMGPSLPSARSEAIAAARRTSGLPSSQASIHPAGSRQGRGMSAGRGRQGVLFCETAADLDEAGRIRLFGAFEHGFGEAAMRRTERGREPVRFDQRPRLQVLATSSNRATGCFQPTETVPLGRAT